MLSLWHKPSSTEATKELSGVLLGWLHVSILWRKT
jgi:hypothetical protein